MAKTTPIIELDENNIKLIKGSFEKGKFTIQEYASIPSNVDFLTSSNAKVLNDQVKRLNELISKVNLKNKRIHVVLPDSVSYSSFLVFPKLKEKELYSAIKFQADQFIPLQLDAASLDIDILEESKDKQKLLILIVATEKKLIERVTELMEINGLIPEVIETQLSALGKLFSYSNVQSIGNSLLINFDYESTTVYFYEKKRRLIFQSHTFKSGYNLFVKELALSSSIEVEKAKFLLESIGLEGDRGKVIEKLVRPVLEDFYNEVRQTINIAQTRHSLTLEGIHLFNLADSIKGFTQYLDQKFSVPVKPLDIPEIIEKKGALPPEVLRLYISSMGSLI